jgi:hypothetical protein
MALVGCGGAATAQPGQSSGYLATRARDGKLAGLAEALPAMLDRTFKRALRERGRVEDDDAMEAFGYVREAACADLVRRALRTARGMTGRTGGRLMRLTSAAAS